MRTRNNKKRLCNDKTGDKNLRKKKINKNQFDSLKEWLEFYNENKKLPYNEIICCECRSYPAKLKGVGFKHALKASNNNLEKMLTSTMCKDCKKIKQPKEKKPVVKRVKTQFEIEEEIEKIRREMPKIDLHSPNQVIDLKKSKQACVEFTRDSCLRPDIYLNNDRTCNECPLNEHCSCRLKKFIQDIRRRK
jgi:hypothetical protein